MLTHACDPSTQKECWDDCYELKVSRVYFASSILTRVIVWKAMYQISSKQTRRRLIFPHFLLFTLAWFLKRHFYAHSFSSEYYNFLQLEVCAKFKTGKLWHWNYFYAIVCHIPCQNLIVTSRSGKTNPLLSTVQIFSETVWAPSYRLKHFTIYYTPPFV